MLERALILVGRTEDWGGPGSGGTRYPDLLTKWMGSTFLNRIRQFPGRQYTYIQKY